MVAQPQPAFLSVEAGRTFQRLFGERLERPRAARPFVEAVTLWHAAVLRAEHRPFGERVRVETDAAWPIHALGTDDGLEVEIPTGLQAVVDGPSGSLDTEDLQKAARVRHHDGRWAVLLREGELLRVEDGGRAIVVRGIWAEPAIRGPRPAPDFAFALLVSALATLLAVVTTWTRMFPSPGRTLGAEDLDVERIIHFEPPPPPVVASNAEPSRADSGASSSASPGPRRPSAARGSRKASGLGSAGRADLDALASAFDSDLFAGGGLGDSVDGAVAGLIGAKDTGGGTAYGPRSRGPGGGGGVQGIGLGPDGSGGPGTLKRHGTTGIGPRTSRGPGGTAGDPIVIGSLAPSEIDRVVRQHLGQIRHCYEKALGTHPGLGGKLSVKFGIAADGTVSTSSVGHSTLANAEVEGCVVDRMRRLRFPPPKGGGVVLVRYPFVFGT